MVHLPQAIPAVLWASPIATALCLKVVTFTRWMGEFASTSGKPDADPPHHISDGGHFTLEHSGNC